MVLAYLMSSQGIGYAEAKEIVEEARPILRLNHGFKDQLKVFYGLLQTYGPAVPQEAITPAMVEGLVPGEGYNIKGSNPTTVREKLHSSPAPQSKPVLWVIADLGAIATCLVGIIAALILMSLVALVTVTSDPGILLLQEINCDNEGDGGPPNDIHLSADSLV